MTQESHGAQHRPDMADGASITDPAADLSRTERRARRYRPGYVRQLLREQSRGAGWTNRTDPAHHGKGVR